MKLEETIIQTISELCLVEASEIKKEDRLREDLGMDSVSSMELLSALAERLDLDIEMEEALEINTVGSVIEVALKRLGDS